MTATIPPNPAGEVSGFGLGGWDWFTAQRAREQADAELDEMRMADGIARASLAEAYRSVFMSPSGLMVMEDLQRWFRMRHRFDPLLNAQLGFFRSGQIDIINYMIDMVREGRDATGS